MNDGITMEYWVSVEPNVKIYVNDINPSGRKTILFIHGWPANHKMFEYQYNELTKMGYRCIGVDTRGFGNSDKPLQGYDYDRLSDDLRCVIEALKLQNITLGGHSTGGAIAVRYMSRHSGYGVSRLGLFAAAAPSLIRRPYFPYGQPREVVIKIIQDTLSDRPRMLRDFGEMFFFQNTTEPFSEWFFQLGLQAASWATAAIANTWLGEERLFYDLTRINVPTLILQGVHDRVVLFPLAVALNLRIKNSKLVPFECSGHGLFYDERDSFNRELSQFIG